MPKKMFRREFAAVPMFQTFLEKNFSLQKGLKTGKISEIENILPFLRNIGTDVARPWNSLKLISDFKLLDCLRKRVICNITVHCYIDRGVSE